MGKDKTILWTQIYIKIREASVGKLDSREGRQCRNNRKMKNYLAKYVVSAKEMEGM